MPALSAASSQRRTAVETCKTNSGVWTTKSGEFECSDLPAGRAIAGLSIAGERVPSRCLQDTDERLRKYCSAVGRRFRGELSSYRHVSAGSARSNYPLWALIVRRRPNGPVSRAGGRNRSQHPGLQKQGPLELRLTMSAHLHIHVVNKKRVSEPRGSQFPSERRRQVLKHRPARQATLAVATS